MSIWVRSQDKLCLMRVEALPILNHDKDSKNTWSILGIGKFQYTLGTYKSKERAIEVLDEIQYKIQCLNDDFYFKVSKETEFKKYEGYQKKHIDIVYQMPEERLNER